MEQIKKEQPESLSQALYLRGSRFLKCQNLHRQVCGSVWFVQRKGKGEAVQLDFYLAVELLVPGGVRLVTGPPKH